MSEKSKGKKCMVPRMTLRLFDPRTDRTAGEEDDDDDDFEKPSPAVEK